MNTTSTDSGGRLVSRPVATTTSDVNGLQCGTTYRFRVSARGDGSPYTTQWGAPSGTVSHAAGLCNRPPVFATSTYAFLVAENAPVWRLDQTLFHGQHDAGVRSGRVRPRNMPPCEQR